MIKALFFDIDGTLVSFTTHRIPQSAVEAISRAKERGIRVYISTGRPYPLIDNIDAIRHMVDGYITANGAYCFSGDHVILCHAIPERDVRTLIRLSDEMRFAAMVVGVKDQVMINANVKSDDIFHKLLNVNGLDNDIPLEQVLSQPILQFTPVIDDSEEVYVMRQLTGSVSSRWNPEFADITAAHVNKGNGLLAVAAYESIGVDETMAFGDGGNDLEILKVAGVGVAMGNANESVRLAADYVTDTVDNDGIAKALAYWLPQER